MSKVLNPAENRAGELTIWNSDEAKLVNERLRYAAQNMFAAGVEGLLKNLGKIAVDSLPGYRKGIPYIDAVRTYRAFNRDST